jgi:DNA-binding IclR family transcriptional regulator
VIKLMEDINVRSRETVVLSTRNGQFAQYVHVLQAINLIRFHIPVGARRLLVRSAAGTVLLSDIPEPEIRLLVSRAYAEIVADHERINFHELLDDIAASKERGYSISLGRVTPGGGQIAMRLPAHVDPQGLPLAIGVSAIVPHIQAREAEIVEIMRSAIDRFVTGEESDGTPITSVIEAPVDRRSRGNLGGSLAP